jgi:hypothetical protein
VLALIASGCSVIPKQPKSTPPPPNTDTTPDQGRIGTPITLRGTQTELEVRVTSVLDPAPASPGDQTLSPRDRFVGVALVLRNIGQGVYAESPLSDSKLFAGATFELRSGLRPSRFQFALDSGFGPEIGTWRLR